MSNKKDARKFVAQNRLIMDIVSKFLNFEEGAFNIFAMVLQMERDLNLPSDLLSTIQSVSMSLEAKCFEIVKYYLDNYTLVKLAEMVVKDIESDIHTAIKDLESNPAHVNQVEQIGNLIAANLIGSLCAVITFDTDAWANSAVHDNTQKGSAILETSQVRNISNIKGSDDRGEYLAGILKAKLDASGNKYNPVVLTHITGSGLTTDSVGSPTYKSGRYVVTFDDFTSIFFNTGYRSDYPYGVYQYTGNSQGMTDFFGVPYLRAVLYWTSQAANTTGVDNWKVLLYV
jgi:hypothetical protein